MNAKDLNLENIYLKILLYGKSGVGKTLFASRFPKPYIFDFDRGTITLKGSDVEFDYYEDIKMMEKKFEEFRHNCPHQTLIFDSVTVMLDRVLQMYLRLNGKESPTQHEYGQRIQWLNGMFTSLSAIPLNIIMIAHEEMIQETLTQSILIRPMLVGDKLPEKCPLYFDEVYRMVISQNAKGEPIRKLLVVGDDRYSAKSRLGLTQAIILPNLKDDLNLSIYTLLMEEIKKANIKK